MLTDFPMRYRLGVLVCCRRTLVQLRNIAGMYFRLEPQSVTFQLLQFISALMAKVFGIS